MTHETKKNYKSEAITLWKERKNERGKMNTLADYRSK